MSIQLEVSVTGPELMGHLLRDEEELAYAFKTLTEDGTAKDIGNAIRDLIFDHQEIADFLREIADAIVDA